MSKKYLYVIIIVLVLCLLGYINLPRINVGQCNGNDYQKTLYIKMPFVNIPINLNVCK